MLTELTTIKARLGLDLLDPTNDALLLRAISAVGARFDLETNRLLARTENSTFEFPATDREILVPCYPIESVAKFELKTSEAVGWIEAPGVDYLIRRRCVISLSESLGNLLLATCDLRPIAARVIYTGGYLLPGSVETLAATALPPELEQAAIEQTAFWFQTRDKIGVIRQWPKGGSYEQFADPDLLPSVREVLKRHTRFTI